MKNLLTATITKNDSETERIRIVCRKDDAGDGRIVYRWYVEEGDLDTEVSSKLLEQAKLDALAAWGADCWSIKATWIK